jgi:DNA-nicking Smr family endonuclease
MNHSPKGVRIGLNSDLEDLVEAMAGVLRLPPDPRGRVRADPTGTTPPRPTPPAPSLAAPDDAAAAEESYLAPGVDRRELRKIKRGDYTPVGRLDLHALTASEAVTKAKQFVDSRRHRDLCICIVHGKGLHSKGSVSVLKTRVRACLRRHPAVRAYADAPRTDGGSGAVYVLLRK